MDPVQGSEPLKKTDFRIGFWISKFQIFGFEFGWGFRIFRLRFEFGSEKNKTETSEILTRKSEILKPHPNPKARFFRVRNPDPRVANRVSVFSTEKKILDFFFDKNFRMSTIICQIKFFCRQSREVDDSVDKSGNPCFQNLVFSLVIT